MLVFQMTLLITNRCLRAYWPAQELLLVPALYTPDGFSALHIASVCPMLYRSEVLNLETPLLESKNSAHAATIDLGLLDGGSTHRWIISWLLPSHWVSHASSGAATDTQTSISCVHQQQQPPEG